MIAMRTGGHDSKFFSQRIACFEKCLSTHAAMIKHLLLVAALEPLNMQIWFNDPFLILHHYSFWDIVNLAKVVITHWNM